MKKQGRLTRDHAFCSRPEPNSHEIIAFAWRKTCHAIKGALAPEGYDEQIKRYYEELIK